MNIEDTRWKGERSVIHKHTPRKTESAQSDERVEKHHEILKLARRIEKHNNEWRRTPISNLPPSLHNLGQILFDAYTNIDPYRAPPIKQFARLLKNWQLLRNIVDQYLYLHNHFDNTAVNRLQDRARAIRSDQMSINNWTTLAAQARDENKDLGSQRYDRFAAPAIAHKQYLVDKTNEDLSALSTAYHAYYNTAQIAWTDYELFIKESSLETTLNITLKDCSTRIREVYVIFRAECEEMLVNFKAVLDDEL